MKLKLATAVLAMGFWSLSAPSISQERPQSGAAPTVLGFSSERERNNILVRRAVNKYASCVVRGHHAHASQALLSNADNDTILKRYPDLVDSMCMTGSSNDGAMLQFNAESFRYALADALVNADLLHDESIDFSGRPALAQFPLPTQAMLDQKLAKLHNKSDREELQKRFNSAASAAILSRYGECIVRRDPAKVRRWLLTPQETAEETGRINELKETFSDCLTRGTVNFSRAVLRGAVAVNYYRLAMAKSQPQIMKAL